jgi:hypothetical protein
LGEVVGADVELDGSYVGGQWVNPDLRGFENLGGLLCVKELKQNLGVF